MPKRKREKKQENPFSGLLYFAETVDELYLRYSGKTLGGWLKEIASRPRELPQAGRVTPEAEKMTPTESDMPLADAYAVMGLTQNCSLDELKKRYRNLALLFHPDRGGNDAAMALLNRAYDRITKEERGQ